MKPEIIYPILTPILALLRSRKFWAAFIPAISGIILYTRGALTADQLSILLAALGSVLVAAIAGEDMAEKVKK